MKFVEDPILTKEEKDISNFNRNGAEPLSKKEKVFAKIIKEKSRTFYYVSTYQSALYDPLGNYSNRERSLETKMRSVSKDTFDYYMIYLQTKNSLYMTRAQRRFINE